MLPEMLEVASLEITRLKFEIAILYFQILQPHLKPLNQPKKRSLN